MSTIIEAEYLYNNSGNHDKIYNIAIIKNNENSYEVIVEWGARLGVLKSQKKFACTSIKEAQIEFFKITDSKKKKKYKTVSQSASSRTIFADKHINDKRSSTKDTGRKSEKYNPDAVPERRLDLDL